MLESTVRDGVSTCAVLQFDRLPLVEHSQLTLGKSTYLGRPRRDERIRVVQVGEVDLRPAVGEPLHRLDDPRIGLFGRHQLQQLHHPDGIEKVGDQKPPAELVAPALEHPLDREARGVRGDDRVVAGVLLDVGERLAFDLQGLGDRLDDPVGLLEAGQMVLGVAGPDQVGQPVFSEQVVYQLILACGIGSKDPFQVCIILSLLEGVIFERGMNGAIASSFPVEANAELVVMKQAGRICLVVQ